MLGRPVRLGAVPTELLLAAKAHIDRVVREMDSSAPTLSAVASTSPLRWQSRGEQVTNLELHLPPDAADAGERYLQALDEVDQFARSAPLLTLATPPAHRLFRQWDVQSLVDQLRCQARGESPSNPPFLAVLADAVDNLTQLDTFPDSLETL